jgi:hypothetical protein
MSYANIAIPTASGQTTCDAWHTPETGKRKMEAGNWRPAFPASSSWSRPIKQKLEISKGQPHFPVSIFQFLVLLNASQIVD